MVHGGAGLSGAEKPPNPKGVVEEQKYAAYIYEKKTHEASSFTLDYHMRGHHSSGNGGRARHSEL
jgi:hypothetical protein